ncbi:MAG: translocation/assembly module TamB domain-containing protein [Flavobacteriales bacterium]|nr:translocation/assembly module TamB domain-containing protein [Flavobacteriales bacterium]
MRWTGIALLWGLILILLLAALLLIPAVQTRVAGWLAEQASESLGTEVRIGRVALALDGSVRVQEVFVRDLRGDTLFHVPELRVLGLRVHPRAHVVKLASLRLDDARFRLSTAHGDERSNLTALLDQLAASDTTAGADWTIRCANFDINALHFSFHNANDTVDPFGVDFEHIDIPDAIIHGHALSVVGDSISASLELLSLSERSGLRIDQLAGETTVSGKGIVIEGLDLRTPASRVDGRLVLESESWRDFNDFTSTVPMRLDLEPSQLNMSDVAWFAHELQGIDFPMDVSGKVRGTISELKGRGMEIGFGQHSRFKGSAELSGLPDMDGTFMLIDVDELRTSPADIERLPVAPFTSGEHVVLPKEADALGDIDFAGRFTGFLRAFTANGRARTALGDLRADVSYERDTLTRRAVFSGRVATASFDLAPIAGTRMLGPIGANLRLNAKGRTFRDMAVDLDGDIPLLTINGRSITGMVANGHLERNLFNGRVETTDENLQMRFTGLADLRGRWPLVDFTADVQHADLKALGFSKAPGYNALNLQVRANGRLSPDSLRGSLDLHGISYCAGGIDYDLGDVHLESDRAMGENILRLDASFAQAEVRGTFLPTKLPQALEHVIYSVFPALGDQVVYNQQPQDFRFEVTARRTDDILGLFVPGLAVDSGARFTGGIDTRSFDLDFGATIPGVRYQQMRFDSLELIADKTLDLLAFSVRSTHQRINDSLWFAGTAVTGKAYQDEVELEVGWETSTQGTHGDLELLGEVRGLRNISLDLLPSRLFFGRGTWANERPAHFEIDSSTVRIDSLILRNGGQQVALDGMVSRDPSLPLAFDIEAFDLLNLEPVLDGPVVNGTVGGDGRIFDLYGAPYVISYLCGDSLRVADKPVGDIRLAVTWLDGQGALDLNGELMRGPIKALDFTGRMALRDDHELDLLLLMDRLDLGFVNPYVPEGLSDIGGLVTGNVALTGTLSDPRLEGRVEVADATLRIDYLNTRYTFTSAVDIAPDMFAIDHVEVHDEEGHTASMGVTVIHERLAHWNYNIWGSMENMLVLNTTPEMNGLYYGKAYGTGDLEVSGVAGSLEVVVDAATGPGTRIHLPVGGSTEVSPISFVRFGGLDSLEIDEDVDLSGVSLDLDVEVTPDAYFELIFDPTVGDIMSGRGQGHIEMGVTPAGDFSMTGQVQITEGDYLFTLRNIVNKRFEVQPGGRIVWYGDPFDAQLDLDAIYRVRASLYDIVPPTERTEAYRKRVPIDVIMRLRDRLMNPEIGFQVRLPTVDESVKAQVNSVLSTDQEMNRQVFALIVLNKFLQPPAYAGAEAVTASGGNVAGTTTSELLSNQVSNWLSNLSNDFDLGFNYRPGDNITQDELELMVSTQLFNERLLLSTNVGVQYGARSAAAAANSNNVVGDFQIEYLMTDDGRFRLRAFSVTNDRNLNQADQAPTTQGGGIVYRKEFDRFWDLFKRKKKP